MRLPELVMARHPSRPGGMMDLPLPLPLVFFKPFYKTGFLGLYGLVSSSDAAVDASELKDLPVA